MALVTRDTRDENLTLPRSKSFPQVPGKFDDEAAALSFAVQYGQTLVDQMHRSNADTGT